MAWEDTSTPLSTGLGANLAEFYILGHSTAPGQNRVSGGNNYTVTESGTTYGSDTIGRYVQTDTGSDYMRINNTSESISDAAFSYMLVFSREGAPATWSSLFEQRTSPSNRFLWVGRFSSNDSAAVSWGGSDQEVTEHDVASLTTSTEQALVITRSGSTLKYFYTGGSSAVTLTGTPTNFGTATQVQFGNLPSAGDVYNARWRAFARWTRALSDSDAQSLANNPQQIVSSPPPNDPSAVTTSNTSFDRTTVSWTDNSADETGFKVRYAPSPYSSWTTATGSVAASPYTVTGLTDGTSYKAAVAAFNANGDSSWVESGVFTTTALTKLRPSADTTTGSWSASSGAVLYTMIDEANADDADYITTSVNATCKIKLETGTDPASGANHVVRVRARGTGGTLRAELVQSATPETTIASWAITYTAAFADYNLSLTTAQADAITDYSALYIKLISS